MQFLIEHLGVLVILNNPEFLTTTQECLALSGHLYDAIVLDILGQIVGKHTLTDHSQQEFLVTLFGTTKHVELIVLVTLYLGCCVTHHHVGNVFWLEALTQRDDRLDCCAQLLSSLYSFLGLQAVVTVAAIILLIGLAKVVQQRSSPAHRRLGIIARLQQQLFPDLLLGNGFALHEFF